MAHAPESVTIWNDFLDTWPVDDLKAMTLHEYTNLKREDSFCYWLEAKTTSLGSIWGGSSYKFGIYKRANTDSVDTRPGYTSDGEYGWLLKYGATRDAAFERVRALIVKVAESAEANNLEEVDTVDLGHAYKWKIAALYHAGIPLIYRPAAIEHITKHYNLPDGLSSAERYRKLAQLKPAHEGILEYSDRLWRIYINPRPAEKDAARQATPEAFDSPLNQIYFGPPGTGKTYRTVAAAVSIVKEINLDEIDEYYGSNRDAIRLDYLDYVAENRIRFCSFHQAFSYEDFVEGIKPTVPDEEDLFVKYEVTPGVFKEMAERANSYEKYDEQVSTTGFRITDNEYDAASFFKMSLGDSQSSDDDEIYKYCIQHNLIALGYGDDVTFQGASNSDIIRKIISNHNLSSSTYKFMRTFKFRMKENDFVLISDGNFTIRAIGKIVGEYEFMIDSPIPYSHFRKVRWLQHGVSIPIGEIYERQLSQQTTYKFDKRLLNRAFFVGQEETRKTAVKKNHVLIIDEINRGNIAEIMGELITLLEPDKRIGRKESTRLTLPYSREEFGVPANLYLIGTMNTADRSVETLDLALRRRFSFCEIRPQAELLENLWAKIIQYQFVTHKKLNWTDPIWVNIEQQLKHLCLNDTCYEHEREELKNMILEKFDQPEDNDSSALQQYLENKNLNSIDFSLLLRTINDRISRLLDDDHCIGHAYFLGLGYTMFPFKALKDLFQNKILPLLREYFFNDFGKIGLVLGREFIERIPQQETISFAKYDELEDDLAQQFNDVVRYRFTNPESWTIETFASIYTV